MSSWILNLWKNFGSDFVFLSTKTYKLIDRRGSDLFIPTQKVLQNGYKLDIKSQQSTQTMSTQNIYLQFTHPIQPIQTTTLLTTSIQNHENQNQNPKAPPIRPSAEIASTTDSSLSRQTVPTYLPILHNTNPSITAFQPVPVQLNRKP